MLGHARLFVTPRTAACQAPLLMGSSRQGYWSGFPFSPPGDLPNPGIKPMLPVFPALANGFLTTKPPGEPWSHMMIYERTCRDTLLLFGVRYLKLSLRHMLQLKSAHPCKLSRFWLFVTPWTVAHQAPLSMEFSKQEYWSVLPFPTLGD